MRSFNIRELDDGSFLLAIHGEDLGESEESSYDSLDDLLDDVRSDLSKGKKKPKEDSDGDKAVKKITRGEKDEDDA